MWACEKFDKCLCDLDQFRLETDHRPLVPLVNNRSLDNVPLRCQRLLIRLMRYKPEVVYVPGKTLVVADALSRSPRSYTSELTDTHSDVECYIATVVQDIPASPSRMDRIKAATANDNELQAVIKLIRNGWPEYKDKVPQNVRAYVKVKSELTETNGLVIRGCRIVIPKSERAEVLKRIHAGHQGLLKCRDRANSSVWRPGLSAALKDTVVQCQTCQEQKRTQQKEPLISTPLPDCPWKRIGLDLCEYNKHNYLAVSDSYSRFLEILHLRWRVTMDLSFPAPSFESLQVKWISNPSHPVRVILKEMATQRGLCKPQRKSSDRRIRHHGARPLPPLHLGDNVIIRLDKEKTWVTPAVVSTEDVTPRSYLLQTLQGATLCRNHRHLRFDNLPHPSSAAVV